MSVSSRPPGAAGAQALRDGADKLVADLTPAQLQAVTTTSGTVCVLAAAGAGKTRALTRRVAYRVATGSARADHVLAITFTRKAAGELRDRLQDLGLPQPVAAGTFHALAIKQLRRWWADRRTPEPVLLERKARVLAELVAGRPGLAGLNLADLAGHIEWAKARLVTPDGFAGAAAGARREVAGGGEAVGALYARYEDEKRRRRLVDFDDLLGRFADALAADERFAQAQRWRWQHVFVDEFQDVNPLQCRLLSVLLGDNRDLFVVGDPNQAIYGWNGADPGFLADFPRRWPEAEVVRLDDNHRSSPQVVAAATAVLGRQATPVRSSRPDGPLPELRSYPTEDAEAAGVASQLLRARAQGLGWGSMAVLARTNAQLDVLAQVLSRAGAPYRSLAGAEEDRLEGRQEGAEEPEAVTLCSFHRSKGLQWQAVWLCGLEAGLVPIAYAGTSAALAEERRLLYVAMTRAERSLHCSWARSRRTGNGASLRREPSPWLASVSQYCQGEDDLPIAAAGAGRTGAGGQDGALAYDGDEDDGAAMAQFLRSARRRLSVAGAARPFSYDARPGKDNEVAQALREWRRRLARASGVPPHVLLHDSTLATIAERRPATADQLLAVPGMGPVKVSRYGPAILEVVRLPSALPVRAGA